MSTRGLDFRALIRRSETFRLNIELSIPPGKTAALLGPNGAGKSTAVASIAGLLPVEAGRIALEDVVLDDPDAGVFVTAEDRRIGVVFQNHLLFPHLNALENVAFGLRSRGVARDEARSTSREWLIKLGIGELALHKPADLSGGQSQRVALARALVTEPDLLLLDEPLSALDVTTRSELRRTLDVHLAVFEGPRLMITHDPTEAFLLADEIHIIEDGEITQSGTADDIQLRPRTRYAADLAGSNFIAGTANEGVVQVGDHTIHVADDLPDGPALVTILPTAVSIHTHRPDGSPRNSWATFIERIERLGSRVRLRVGGPLPLTAELTEAARSELRLEAGDEVWVAIKATEVGVEPDRPPDH